MDIKMIDEPPVEADFKTTDKKCVFTWADGHTLEIDVSTDEGHARALQWAHRMGMHF